MSWNFHLSAYTHNSSPANKVVAITFDDGPHPEYTPVVLKLLSDFNATATFFCIGNRVEEYPEVLKSIVAKGHEIGNHSYSHSPFIDFKGQNSWEAEINKTDAIIEQHTGHRPSLFRPPYGVTTPPLSNVIKKSSHRVIGWSVRSFDTVIKNPNFLLKRITKKINAGDIILLHDTHKNIPFVLEHLLLFLSEKGYKTVSITQLHNDKSS
ncbi:polysaccharide deacetylase family protein [Ulvibacter sp. MAR_2010_11]|uniref:polysaccharide deacetylase family protein n=1 Tax=Ulvibacter sp. MAR_2010_11 TaxID=1250229 RepID=UPI0012FD17E8|nr:polysaccharide deacetylase family protein [Ulvibacter sp. MAR_2010_11]